MVIDGKIPEGYVVLCGKCNNQAFLVRRLGVSVECPNCGSAALSTDLIDEFYRKTAAPAEARP